MKRLFFIILMLANFAWAQSSGQTTPRNFELMKCNSQKHGTLWASFGHMIRSGEDKVIYFPTEIVVFASDLASRLLFPKLEDALKIFVDVQNGLVRMDFSVPNGSKTRNHSLRIAVYDPRAPNSYVGNWAVTDDADPVHDEVYCTLD